MGPLEHCLLFTMASADDLAKHCSERDQQILSQDESLYKPIPWAEVQDIVATNDLVRLSRKPSDLRFYLEKKQEFNAKYGGTMQYIVKEKLQWELPTVPCNTRILSDPTDTKILLNDFPYRIEANITHFVVWLKAKIPEEADGVLSQEVKDRISLFVKKTFQDYFHIRSDQIVWFKNWSALQSVAELEHFHVMVQDAPQEKISNLVGTCGAILD